jgi:Tfp pilus assembly protein PilF
LANWAQVTLSGKHEFCGLAVLTIRGKQRMRYTRFGSALGVVMLLCGSASPMADAPPDKEAAERPTKLAAEALRRGEELRRNWNLDSAEAAFREAATLEPASLDAALGLARIARARIEYAYAISLLDKAASEHPNSTDVLNEYGSVYLAAEEPKRARAYFERALRTSASDIATIIGLAGVLLLERDYDRATQSLRECLAREPQDSHPHAMLARALLESNKTSEAGEEAERAIALDPYNVEALYALACVRSSQRKADEARLLAQRVVSLDPFNVGARHVLSQYLDGQKGYQQRVSEQARGHYWNGRALKQEGELAKAVMEFEAALRIEPRYYGALIALADVWLRQGDCERAAVAAKLATAVDPDGALAHLELSCAYRSINERARIEIGAVDFAALFYGEPAPPAYSLTREIFPNYGSLTKRQQVVIDGAVAPLAGFLPKLAHNKARHYLLSFDQRPVDLNGFVDVANEKTFDGRYYASLRGVGGRVTVSGIEYLDQAARGGFNTIAHEFAHQVHIAAMGEKEAKEIHKLYERARSEGRTLDYYAAANEYEYFAQGYEAFISCRKRPSAGVTGRHTTHDLLAGDPELYKFLLRLTGKSPATKGAEVLKGASNSDCLTRNNAACKYAGGAFPVGGGQQRRLLRAHPRVALNSAQHSGYLRKILFDIARS